MTTIKRQSNRLKNNSSLKRSWKKTGNMKQHKENDSGRRKSVRRKKMRSNSVKRL
jgi:hypothetical protein